MSVSHEGITFERLGHASVKISTPDERIIYIDPWSEVITGTPHDADLIVVTHDDRDHFDPEAIADVAGENATVAAYEKIDTDGMSLPVVGLPIEGTTSVEGIDIRTFPSHNDPEGDHVGDDGEPFHAYGEVIGVILTIDGVTVFYPSDTDFLDHYHTVRTDVFIPPIGGHYTMDRTEAAAFAKSVEPDLVLPVHYDTFDAIQTDVDAFVEELEFDGIRVEVF